MKLCMTMKTNDGVWYEGEVDLAGRDPHETVQAVTSMFAVPRQITGEIAELQVAIEIGQGDYESADLDFAGVEPDARPLQVEDACRRVQQRVCPHTSPSEQGACEACGAVLAEARP